MVQRSREMEDMYPLIHGMKVLCTISHPLMYVAFVIEAFYHHIYKSPNYQNHKAHCTIPMLSKLGHDIA